MGEVAGPRLCGAGARLGGATTMIVLGAFGGPMRTGAAVMSETLGSSGWCDDVLVRRRVVGVGVVEIALLDPGGAPLSLVLGDVGLGAKPP